jgi:hypothetical protein
MLSSDQKTEADEHCLTDIMDLGAKIT